MLQVWEGGARVRPSQQGLKVWFSAAVALVINPRLLINMEECLIHRIGEGLMMMMSVLSSQICVLKMKVTAVKPIPYSYI